MQKGSDIFTAVLKNANLSLPVVMCRKCNKIHDLVGILYQMCIIVISPRVPGSFVGFKAIENIIQMQEEIFLYCVSCK
jgi:hypothetical protein